MQLQHFKKRISPIICTKMKNKDINDEYQKHKNKNFKDYAHNTIDIMRIM